MLWEQLIFSSYFIVLQIFVCANSLYARPKKSYIDENERRCKTCNNYINTGISPYQILWSMANEIAEDMPPALKSRLLLQEEIMIDAEQNLFDYCDAYCLRFQTSGKKGVLENRIKNLLTDTPITKFLTSIQAYEIAMEELTSHFTDEDIEELQEKSIRRSKFDEDENREDSGSVEDPSAASVESQESLENSTQAKLPVLQIANQQMTVEDTTTTETTTEFQQQTTENQMSETKTQDVEVPQAPANNSEVPIAVTEAAITVTEVTMTETEVPSTTTEATSPVDEVTYATTVSPTLTSSSMLGAETVTPPADGVKRILRNQGSQYPNINFPAIKEFVSNKREKFPYEDDLDSLYSMYE